LYGHPVAAQRSVKTERLIEEALETALREKPLWFFTNIIMPLLPRETRAAVEAGDKVVEWRGLMGVVAGEGEK
jgi:hypothetical protein